MSARTTISERGVLIRGVIMYARPAFGKRPIREV